MITVAEIKKKRISFVDDILKEIEDAILSRESLGIHFALFRLPENTPASELIVQLQKAGYGVTHSIGVDRDGAYNYLNINWE